MSEQIENQYKQMTVQSIDIGRIKPNPNQPRTVFDEEALADLARSIQEHGVLQPITVRRLGMLDYELVAGERRLRASQLAGFSKIPAIVLRIDEEESTALALIENIQREDLNYFEEARAYQRLMDDYGLRQEQLAEMVGKSQPAVANKLRLLRLPEEQQQRLTEAGLSERHARALLQCKDDAKRAELLEKAASGSLTVAKLEQLVAEEAAPEKKKKQLRFLIKDIRIFVNSVREAADLMRQAGFPVEIDEKREEEYYEMTVRVPYNKK